MTPDKTWRDWELVVMEKSQPEEYAKCLCPSCYVLHCANRKKSAVIGGIKKEETHFEKLDSF